MATGETEWLGLAREYMRFCDCVGDYHFKMLRVGKVGWAGAMLYTLTGDAKYRDIAVRVGNILVEAQMDNGAWAWPEMGVPGPTTTPRLRWSSGSTRSTRRREKISRSWPDSF